MKKILGLGIVLLSSALLFAGCGSSKKEEVKENSDGKTKVTFWAAAVSEDRQEFFDWFGDYVSEKYPNIELDMLGVPGSLNDYRQKLDVAIQAGTAPDITNDFRPALVTNGYYENLNDYFDKWEDKDLISEDLINSNKTYDPQGENLYALPYSSQTWNMWARVDWLKEIGKDIPTTWDDFFTDTQTLTDKSKDRFGMAIRGGAGSANTLEMLMYAYSGITNYFDEDGNATIDDPKNEEFVQKYLVDSYGKVTAEDDLTKSATELSNAFQSDKAGFFFHNLGSGKAMATAFENDYSKFQAATFPVSEEGYIVHPSLMPLGLSMSSKSKNKDEVWDVMSLYLSKEVQEKYCELYGEIPANSEAREGDFFKNTQYMTVGTSIMNKENVKFNDTPYYLPTYVNIQTDMEPNIQAVMSGSMTPKELLATWAEELESAKKDYEEMVK
ncbi:ABC transporter substrate-binding protein [Enterococcus nangangensis]|uniref:ABC transporter substrate-binding protein n=1 Tax=Enterococcus nangangensis TaxID=2559926 RepID=UPI001484E63D|nr:sugar ABC transporter substrate-binding protein [Enterococcus nangangensis]